MRRPEDGYFLCSDLSTQAERNNVALVPVGGIEPTIVRLSAGFPTVVRHWRWWVAVESNDSPRGENGFTDRVPGTTRFHHPLIVPEPLDVVDAKTADPGAGLQVVDQWGMVAPDHVEPLLARGHRISFLS